MADLSEFLSDSEGEEFELMAVDKDGKEFGTGVKFTVVSLDNPKSQAVVKRAQSKIMGRKLRGEEVPDEDVGSVAFMSMDPTDEQLAHCVVDWDWGENTLGDLKTSFSYENVLAAISKVSKIRTQVKSKVLEISDFTKA